MKSRWIINLLLLVAIGILILVAYFEPGIDEQTEATAITTLQKDQLHRIHLNRPLRDDLVLVKKGTRSWIIEHTPELPADNYQVNALQRLAEQKAVRSYPASELDLAQLQLDPPYATAVLNDTAIEFGNLEPLEGLRYVRVADQVHLIPDLYLQLIEVSYTQFVRRRLFDENTRIARITLADFSIAKSDQGWTVEPQQEVSADNLQQFVDRWQAATGVHIQAADSTAEGEAVKLIQADTGHSINFVISAREPELVLVRADLGIQYRMGDLGGSLLSLTAPESGDQQ
ncbi:MAG: DUF4340 domain-containing protein [Pseudomonadota bacterium]|nr:DUF4340 domain-containing protein [Pseudomonadota bacterium]